jgi:energy-coupling factor transporter ATP-binding protein EcfA2
MADHSELPAIEIDGISKAFGPTVALDGVSFRIAPGSVHALLGENGAGKSTLVKLLSGLVRPSQGHVRVFGKEIAYGAPRAAHAHERPAHAGHTARPSLPGPPPARHRPRGACGPPRYRRGTFWHPCNGERRCAATARGKTSTSGIP